jgi:mRNA interferase MazF
MGEIAVRTVVTVRFPFSDLSQSKLRPAVVLADAGRGDWVLCQITSRPYGDVAAVRIEGGDFKKGSLSLVSYARRGKLFTANDTLLGKPVGQLNSDAHAKIVRAVVQLLEAGKF